VSTYGAIAALLGSAKVARHVGWALAALPRGARVPWHRVLNAAGAISRGDPTRAVTQRSLLVREGVAFNPRGRVDLDRFGWRPRRRGR
jgi:methylated-DNA-protein-cysteine methyltransferase-like protein